ncbi:MAG: lactoylglutathione lyase [Deltaproteobacteria bacterium]|nr:lactoylglutathione lyase [Deltaproteobacteria bacterium]
MKFLHTMIRVRDLEASVRFYCDVLGMRELRRTDYPGGRFTLVFVGFGDERDQTVVELTHNWDQDDYEIGDAFGHLAFGVDDIYATCDDLRAAGAILTREPGPMQHGSTVIAFLRDPDGYAIELIQQSLQPEGDNGE